MDGGHKETCKTVCISSPANISLSFQFPVLFLFICDYERHDTRGGGGGGGGDGGHYLKVTLQWRLAILFFFFVSVLHFHLKNKERSNIVCRAIAFISLRIPPKKDANTQRKVTWGDYLFIDFISMRAIPFLFLRGESKVKIDYSTKGNREVHSNLTIKKRAIILILSFQLQVATCQRP